MQESSGPKARLWRAGLRVLQKHICGTKEHAYPNIPPLLLITGTHYCYDTRAAQNVRAIAIITNISLCDIALHAA